MDDDEADPAALLMELAPLVMRVLREEVRRSAPAELSMPQFRLLTFLARSPGASLSETAERCGMALPSASKHIDSLLTRGLVTRQEAVKDRRRVTLAATPEGETLLSAAHAGARLRLAELLADLTPEQQRTVEGALELIRQRLAGKG